jgi:hypothetical protein
MIELIFSIVIMGLVLMSAPMLITTATHSSAVAFEQESIAIVATRAHALMTYAWDEQNTAQDDILSTGSPNAALQARSVLQTGKYHRQITSPGSAASSSSTFGFPKDLDGSALETVADDVDDFDGHSVGLKVITGSQKSNQGEYIDQDITIHVAIDYANDSASSSDFSTCTVIGSGCSYKPTTPATGTTNVKFFTTTLTTTATTQVSTIDDKQIVLKGFMCNIGVATLNKGTK